MLEVLRNPQVPLNIRVDYSDQALESKLRKVHRHKKVRDNLGHKIRNQQVWKTLTSAS